MNRFHVIIPARLASTRLPRKPLTDLGGQPLVLRVHDRARTSGALSVHVATDSEEIAAVVEKGGGEVVMTSSEHRSGTDRLSEAAHLLGLADDAVVVNLQGDEPDMPPECIQQVSRLLQEHPGASISTLWWPIERESEWHDPNVVKLVADKAGRALYFSRAAIPHVRGGDWPQGRARRHVGLYAYRAGALAAWPNLVESELESFESLEQLRALDAGWSIVCEQAAAPVPPGIDTVADVQHFVERLGS